MRRIRDEWTAPYRADITRLEQRVADLSFDLGNLTAENVAMGIRLTAADGLAKASRLVVRSVQSPHMNTDAWVEQDLVEALAAYEATAS